MRGVVRLMCAAVLLMGGAPSTSTASAPTPASPHPAAAPVAPVTRAPAAHPADTAHGVETTLERSAKRHPGRSHTGFRRRRRHGAPAAQRRQPAAAVDARYRSGETTFVSTSPGYLTTIALAPGEKVLARAAGDTRNWDLAEASEGVGKDARPIILLKPAKTALRTNLVLVTNKRTYLMVASSFARPRFTSYLSWSYADEKGSAATAAPPPNGAAADPPRALLPFTRLNMGYRLAHPSRGRSPPWTPKRVFDDGVRTYVQFPKSFAEMAAPPMFAVGPSDAIELINYRTVGQYYVVDRLIDKAELIYGERRQDVISIERTGRQ